MTRSTKDWNFDRMSQAQAMMQEVERDMSRAMHKGKVVDVVKERMIENLRHAANDLAKLKLDHGPETDHG